MLSTTVQRPLSRIGENARYRWAVFFRVFAGFIGSYVIAAYVTAITALLLPMPRAEAVVLASMLSYLWLLGFIIWAFAIKSLLKLWLIFGGLIGLLGVGYMLLKASVGV